MDILLRALVRGKVEVIGVSTKLKWDWFRGQGSLQLACDRRSGPILLWGSASRGRNTLTGAGWLIGSVVRLVFTYFLLD